MHTEYSIALWKKLEQVADYYENHDSFAMLQQIMAFINVGIDLIPASLYFIPKEAVDKYRAQAQAIWAADGSPEKLEAVNHEYNKQVSSAIPFRALLDMPAEYGAYTAVGWYLSNYHDLPTNQFVYDFIELYVSELNRTGVSEEDVDKLLHKHFGEIIDTWEVENSEYDDE